MKMNKRAMQMGIEFLAGLLVLLVVAIILLMIYGKSGSISKEHKTADICRQTIETNAIGNVAGISLYDEIKCPIEYKEISSTKAEEIKEVLAKSMASCWYKMGEGEYGLFDTALLSTSGERTIQYCIICSVAEFEGSQKEKIEGFLDYLNNNKAPMYYTKYYTKEKTLSKALSYTEYLQGFSSDKNLQLLYEQETKDIIDTNYDYATIFLYAKKGYINKVWSSVAGGAVGIGAGLIGGFLIIGGVTAPAGIAVLAGGLGAAGGYALGSEKTADWESGVLVYPYDTEELKKLDCDLLPAQQQNI